MASLGVNIGFYTGDPYADLVQLGREAEEAGYDCLMVPEGIAGNDALLCCYMLAVATSRIHIVPNVANIYLRDASLCAVTSATIQQASHGRFILGIGVSHRPVLKAMGIETGNARARLRDYYETEGREDEVLIDLPKGGYVPAFRNREMKAEAQGRGTKGFVDSGSEGSENLPAGFILKG